MTDYVYEGLKHIHAKMQDPNNWDDDGICGHLRNYLIFECGYSRDQASDVAGGLFGGSVFPIAHPTDPDNRWAYMAASPREMWDRTNSAYAEKRWDWLEWLIEKHKKLVD